MAAARVADVLARDIGRQTAGNQRQILLQGHFDPAVLVDWVRVGQLEWLDGARQSVEAVAGNLAQEFLSGGQGAFRRDHRRGAAVVSGARFFHIGDGDQADFVARLRLIELALDGSQRHLLRLEIVLGGEHIEVALRHALHQILLRGLVVRFRLRHLGVRGFQGHPILPAKDILPQVDAVAMRRGVDAAVEGKALQHGRSPGGADRFGGIGRTEILLAGHEAAARELRQQGRECLRLGFQGGQTGRFGFAQLRDRSAARADTPRADRPPAPDSALTQHRAMRVSNRFMGLPIASMAWSYSVIYNHIT